MPVNEAKSAPDETPATDAATFQVEGKNTELLAVRVAPEMMAVLRKVADRSKRPVPEMVRFFLTFHLLPDMVNVATQKLQSGEGLELYSGARFRLEEGKRQLEHVQTACAEAKGRLEVIQSVSEKTRLRFEEAERIAAAAYGDYIQQLIAESNAFEANPEAFAPDSFAAKVANEAAKIEEEERE